MFRSFPRTVGLALICALGCCLPGCQSQAIKDGDGQATASAATASKAVDERLRIEAPLRYKNLSIFPVVASEPRDTDRFITLEEGLAAGTVEIFEIGAPSSDNADNPAAQPQSVAPFDSDPFAPEPPNEAAPSSSNEAAPSAPDNSNPFGDTGPVDTNPFAAAQPPAANDNPFTDADPFADNGQSQETNAAQSEGIPPNVTPQELEVTDTIIDTIADAAQVERVVVRNLSDKPLYLMPGEIILGGKQDRSLARETIVPPDGKPFEVEVFCVEHGRWSGRTQEEFAQLAPSADQSFPGNLSMIVSNAEGQDASQRFVASAGALNKAGRLAVQGDKDQSKVWEQISLVNNALGNPADSDTFIGNYANEDVREQLQPYLDELQAQVADRPQIVGVIVAIDGKVEGADIFESTPLFKKLWPKLLQSYAFDALSTDIAEPDSAAPQATLADAEKFLNDLQQARVKDSETVNDLVLTSRETASASIFSAQHADALSSGGMGGGFGGAVHTSAYAK
jgi:hypothetical protein